MIYKHKQLSTKLVGADFSAPRASFPACTEPLPELVEGRSKLACAELACAEPVEASKHRSFQSCRSVIVSSYQIFKPPQTISNNIIMSKCHCIIMSNLQIIKSSKCQNVKSSNFQIFK